LSYALASVRKSGRGPFTDDEWALVLRLWRYAVEFNRRVEQMLDQPADWVRQRREPRHIPFTDTEAWLIIERSGVLQYYQDQLAERVRRLQVAEREEATDEAGSGPDSLLTVISL